MNFNRILFDMNDAAVDQKIMAAKYDFFGKKKGFATAIWPSSVSERNATTATMTENKTDYNKLSTPIKMAFRKYFVYEMNGEFANVDGFTPAECLELLQFLNYSCIDTHQDYFNNLPRLRRFIHEHRDNEELTRATILIHHNPYYVIGSNDDRDVINMYCMTIGVDIRLHWKKKYEIFASGASAMHKHLQAICLGEQELGCDNDAYNCDEIFHQNWQENQFTISYARWVDVSSYNQNVDVDAIQLQKNWDEKKCAESLHVLARYYDSQEPCNEKCWRLYLLNWEENKHYDSLSCYIHCLIHGYGRSKDEKLANDMNRIYRALIT